MLSLLFQQVVYHLYQLSNSLSASTTEMVNSLRTICTNTKKIDSPDVLCKQSLEEVSVLEFIDYRVCDAALS